jgi:beta-lactamase class A
MRTRWIARLLAVLVLASCGDNGPPPARPTPSKPAPPVADPPDPGPAEATLPLPAGFPDTTAGRQLAWVVDVIAKRSGAVDVAEVEKHFDAAFLAQVPADQTVAVFGQLAQQTAGLVVNSVTPEAGGLGLVASAEVEGTRLRISLAIDPKTEKISGLLFSPEEDTTAKPTSLAEAEKMLPTLATRAQMLVASVDKGKCKPLHQVASKDQLAIGSTAKLYILLGLVDQIVAGKLTWDTEIAVKDEWKSLPSGVTQDDAAGTKLTLRTLAERMISISDNTATDHVLYTVGRKKVEAAVAASKHAKPKLNAPFLSTRELFLLKLGPATDEADKYVELSAEKRRAVLDGKLATMKPTLEGVEGWTAPRRIDSLEWFASADDLCRLMATLVARANKSEKAKPVLDVLSKNPGLSIDTRVFPYIGFKGGSEPGVMNLTWLLRRDDDRWFVVSLGFNTSTTPVFEDSKIIGFATGLLELVGRER